MSEKKNDYLFQGGLLAAAGLVTRIIGMIYRIPLKNLIGSEAMGYYSAAYEIYNLALILSTYSVPVAVSKLVSARDAEHRYRSSARVFRASMAISGILGLIMALVVVAYSNELAGLIDNPAAAIPLRYLAPTIFVFAIMGVIRGFFQGQKTMVPTSISQIIEQIFNAVGSVAAAALFVNAFADTARVAQYGAAGGTTGTLIGAIFGLIFLILIFIYNRPYFKSKEKKDTSEYTEEYSDIARDLLLTMLPIILSQTVYHLSGIIDVKLFHHLMSARGMDEASRSIQFDAFSNEYKWLYNVPVAIASAFGVTIVPVLSSLTRSGDINAIREKIAGSVKVNMVIAIPAAVGLGVLGRPILQMLFRTDVSLGGELLMLGSSAVVFFALSTLTNGILQGTNHLHRPVVHSAVSLAIHIGIDWLLVGYLGFGVYGLVIGNVTYGLLVSILNWVAIDDLFDYRQELKTTFLIPILSSVIMGATGYGIYRLLMLLLHSNMLSVIISLIWSVLIYFVLMIVFRGISRDELKGFPKGRYLVRFAEKLRILR